MYALILPPIITAQTTPNEWKGLLPPDRDNTTAAAGHREVTIYCKNTAEITSGQSNLT